MILGILMIAPLSLTQCGEGESVASKQYGPVGPTYPSGYYFRVIVTPHTVPSGSSCHVDLQVWDSNGNAAGGVPAAVAGTDTVDDNNFITTNEHGQGGWVLEVKGDAGTIFYITVQIEDKQVTAPVQIVATVGAAGGGGGGA